MEPPHTQGSTVVEARDVTFSYGALRMLKGLSLSVRAGEVFGLLGASGAGKTPPEMAEDPIRGGPAA